MSDTPLSSSAARHIEEIRAHYENEPTTPRKFAGYYRHWLARYYNLLIPKDATVLEIGCGSGNLLSLLNTKKVTGLDISEKQIAAARKNVPWGTFHVQSGESANLTESFDYIIVSDTLTHAADIQRLLSHAQGMATSRTRLLLNFPSALWRPAYKIAEIMQIRSKHPVGNWLTAGDVNNLLELSDWETISFSPRILAPLPHSLLSVSINKWIAPLLPFLCLTVFCVARPIRKKAQSGGVVSVIIPARNEAGNILSAVARTPEMGDGTEIVFVEGNSSDDTWERIKQVKEGNPHRRITILQQSGKGKGDAVRAGFAAAAGDILMILDADLTVPPEELPKFHEAVSSGKCDFANGVRLVYPMEKKAMRFMNLCANKFFSVSFSWLLGQPVKDTLCGTKVLRRCDYEKISANRSYFGDFDPFGDFDLLFGADKLLFKIKDIPIRYHERTYGTTNIQRWRHGVVLLRMMIFAARKIKFC